MTKWHKLLMESIHNELKECCLVNNINARHKPTVQLVENIITQVLDNISYGKYIKCIERTCRHGESTFMNMLLNPFPADCFVYRIEYKNNISQLIYINRIKDIVNLPNTMINTIYSFVKRHTYECKNGIKLNPIKWYFKPSSCIKVHNELNFLWMASGMNDFVAKSLGNYCKCSLERNKHEKC